MTTTHRRHDIDWLRVLAFFILIAYHIGMYYVLDWGWHIKSDVQSRLLQDVMILSNQWRMSLLFMIAAIALGLYEQRHGLRGMLRNRAVRLLIPLIVGMLLIVPPQLFVELGENINYDGSYLAFLSEYYDLDTSLAPEKQSVIGLLTWNHLWFLPYLFCYSVLLLAVRYVIKAVINRFSNPSVFAFVSIAVLVMSCIWLGLRKSFPVTHDLVNDWYSHGKYFWVFVLGYSLTYLPQIWQKISTHRRRFLIIALCCYAFIIADRWGWWTLLADNFEQLFIVRLFYAIVVTLNHWAWLFCIIGYAGTYLQFSNRFLQYANHAVLPWYIIHQTAIVVVAAWLKPTDIPTLLELVLIITLTVTSCYVFHEACKRFWLTRVLVGLKGKSS